MLWATSCGAGSHSLLNHSFSQPCLVWPCGGAWAQSAQDIIAAADKVRNPGEPFRSTTTLTEYVRGKPKDSTTLVVYSKEDKASGQFRNLVRYVEPPRDAGKMALLDGQNLWFYDPAAKSSVRISTQQRLVGQAAIGDVLTINFAVDYTGTLLGDETITDAEKQRGIAGISICAPRRRRRFTAERNIGWRRARFGRSRRNSIPTAGGS